MTPAENTVFYFYALRSLAGKCLSGHVITIPDLPIMLQAENESGKFCAYEGPASELAEWAHGNGFLATAHRISIAPPFNSDDTRDAISRAIENREFEISL